MARTTLDIDDAVLRELKKVAASQGRTLQWVVNEYLKRAAPRGPSPDIDWSSPGGMGKRVRELISSTATSCLI